MSTPSIIGTTDGTNFEGLPCHYDGYPTGMVPDLAKIITRDGHAALPILTGKTKAAHGGATGSWESLVATMPAPDVELLYDNDRDYFDNVPAAERNPGVSLLYGRLGRGDESKERGRLVEGYGIVNTGTRAGTTFGTLDTPRTWIGWAYLFTEDLSLVVYEIEGNTAPMRERERFTRDELAALADGNEALAARVSQAECGERYERCSHYAWAHDDSIPEESRYLAMDEWLGLEPMRPDCAVAAIVDGTRYELSRSGRLRGGKWHVGIKGSSEYVALFKVSKTRGYVPLPGVELFFPPTKADVVAKAGV